MWGGKEKKKLTYLEAARGGNNRKRKSKGGEAALNGWHVGAAGSFESP